MSIESLLIDHPSKNSEEKFVRFESKYLFPIESMRGLKSLLEAFLDPVDGTKTHQFTRVESFYFDSPELKFFLDSLAQAPERLKMRIRRYWNGGVQFSGSYFELKSKENGVSKKKRFAIGTLEQQELLRGETIAITPRLETQNYQIGLQRLISRVEKVNQLICGYQLKPFLKVGYDRMAFEKNGLRVTIDQNFQIEGLYPLNQQHGLKIINQPNFFLAQQMSQMFSPKSMSIIEVKHQGVIPNWLSAGFKSLGCEQNVSFSKYIWGLSQFAMKLNLGERNHNVGD